MNATDQQRLDTLYNFDLTPQEQEEANMIIQSDPDAWQKYGDLNSWTRDTVLAMVQKNFVRLQSTVEGLKQLRQELLADGQSAVERIAVEQIITAHIQSAKTGYMLERLEPTAENQAEAKHWAKVHNLAQCRLMRAMNHLMRLRKAILDRKLKLYRNRPLEYDGNDYLDISGQELDVKRQLHRKGLSEQLQRIKEAIAAKTQPVGTTQQKPDSLRGNDSVTSVVSAKSRKKTNGCLGRQSKDASSLGEAKKRGTSELGEG
jgi:hypothetical protein